MGLDELIQQCAAHMLALHQAALDTEATQIRIGSVMSQNLATQVELSKATKENLEMALTTAELIKAMDDATTKVAERLKAALDTIANGSATATELATAKSAIQAEIDKLTAMGKDEQAV